MYPKFHFDQLHTARNIAVSAEKKLFGCPIKYCSVIIGAVALILIIAALGVDILWNEIRWIGGSMTSWAMASPSSDINVDDLKNRGKTWLAMGILNTLAATAGVVCSIVDKHVTFMSDKVKKIWRPIPFVVSALIILLGSAVIASYHAPSGADSEVGTSSIIGFIVAAMMAAPVCLLWFVMNKPKGQPIFQIEKRPRFEDECIV